MVSSYTLIESDYSYSNNIFRLNNELLLSSFLIFDIGKSIKLFREFNMKYFSQPIALGDTLVGSTSALYYGLKFDSVDDKLLFVLKYPEHCT